MYRSEQQGRVHLLTAGPQWETEQQQMDFGDTAISIFTPLPVDQAGNKTNATGCIVAVVVCPRRVQREAQKEKPDRSESWSWSSRMTWWPSHSTAETLLEFNPPSSVPGCN